MSKTKTFLMYVWLFSRVSVLFGASDRLAVAFGATGKEWSLWLWASIGAFYYASVMVYCFEYVYLFALGETRKGIYLFIVASMASGLLQHEIIKRTSAVLL